MAEDRGEYISLPPCLSEFVREYAQVCVRAKFENGFVMSLFKIVYGPDSFPKLFVINPQAIFKIATFAAIIKAKFAPAFQTVNNKILLLPYELHDSNIILFGPHCDTP